MYAYFICGSSYAGVWSPPLFAVRDDPRTASYASETS